MRIMLHRYGPLIEGVLVRRYKRFLADVRLADGGLVTAFCPNSGSMLGLNAPGTPAMLSHTAAPGRKTAHTLELLRPGRSWVGVNTHLTNALAGRAMGLALVRELAGCTVIRREVTVGDSRLDYLLDSPGGPVYVEVKSVTLRAGREARFPDAVIARGARHLAELSRIARSGSAGAHMIFMVQRADCRCFAPEAEIDPAWAEAFRHALCAGVGVSVCGLSVSPRGVYFTGQLPLCD